MDKLFMELIFAYVTMLGALFNFPRWMNLFGFHLYRSRSVSLSTWSNSIWGEVKTTFSSGSNKLGLWATSAYRDGSLTLNSVKGCFPTTVSSVKGCFPTTVSSVKGRFPTKVSSEKGRIPATLNSVHVCLKILNCNK